MQQDYLDYLIQQAINKNKITSPDQQTVLAEMIYAYAQNLQDASASAFTDPNCVELDLKRDSASINLINYPYAYELEQAFEEVANEYLRRYKDEHLFKNDMNQSRDLDEVLPSPQIIVEDLVEEVPTVEELFEEEVKAEEAEEASITTQLLDIVKQLADEVKNLRDRQDALEVVKQEVEKIEEEKSEVEEEEKEEDSTEIVEETTTEKVLDENLEPIV
jgi:hemoglobin-like flavoprotein